MSIYLSGNQLKRSSTGSFENFPVVFSSFVFLDLDLEFFTLALFPLSSSFFRPFSMSFPTLLEDIVNSSLELIFQSWSDFLRCDR